MNYKWETSSFKKFLMFENLILNLSRLIAICDKTKRLQKKPLNIWKNFLHKFKISFETYNNCKYLYLAHLKLEAFNNLKTSLPQTSNFNVETFNILKNSFTLTWNLNIQKPFFHIWNFITLLKKSLPRLPFT
jgi:hypothetical protein